MRKCLLSLYVGASALYLAGAAAADETRNCADTFQTPEFQALDLMEPYRDRYLLGLVRSLKGQTCKIDQLEAFFNARHAVTIFKDSDRISFRATLKTSGLIFRDVIGIGASIKGARISYVYVALETP